jgi:hypothetical protein
MLFVVLMKAKPGSTRRSRIQRRLDWQYPEGMKVLSEHWLTSSDPTVVLVAQSDDVRVIHHAITEWDDVFDFTVIPAVTAEEGIAQARREMATARA